MSPFQIEEIKNAYARIYAPGLDKFFETKWFQIRGLNHVLNDHRLCDQFAAMLYQFSININDPKGTKLAQNLEATVVWAMMDLARQVANRPNPTNEKVNESELDAGISDAAERVSILEKLILGEHFDAKPDSDSKAEHNGNTTAEQGEIRKKQFWRHVRTFLALRDDEASAAREIDDTLISCRTVLESLENRDVIYSIVIARHIGQRLAEFPDNLQRPTTNDEAENRNKLHVAKSFIERQQQFGTTQVVQRVCNMVVKSWTLPR